VVVCVDDDPQVLNAVQRLLRREPYELLTTDKPETALRWLGEGGVRLLITDLRMPQMDGRELIKVVEERFPGTASLILTGYPDQVPTRSRPRLIAKPWNDTELKDAIRSLVEPQAAPRGSARAEGRMLIVAEDERVRSRAGAAAEHFHVQVESRVDAGLRRIRECEQPLDLVVVDSTTPVRPLREALPEAIFVVMAEAPSSDQVGYWYDLGVEQILRLTIAPGTLADLFQRCIPRARARRQEAGQRSRDAAQRARESWPRRARRTLLGWIQAPGRSRTGERRTLLTLSAAAVLIGILLGAAWRGLQRIPLLDVAASGRDPLERFWRMSTEDQALRRWYMMQQLEINREVADETRRFHDLQVKPPPPTTTTTERPDLGEPKQR